MNDIIELFVSIYTDEDVGRTLAEELRERGFRAQSVHDAGLLGADDRAQITDAIENRMAFLTYNRAHFYALAEEYNREGKHHNGIIISTEQFSEDQFGELLRLTLKLLDALLPEELQDRVVFLQQFK